MEDELKKSGHNMSPSTKTNKETSLVSTSDEIPPTSTESRQAGIPLNPRRCTRLQEKQQLQNLNDRLARYIDNVRYLHAENLRLTREVQEVQEASKHEVSSINSMYEQELSDTRKLLDVTAKERAKLEIDMRRLWDNKEELKNKLEKKTKDLQITEKSLSLYEAHNNNLSYQLSQERKKLTNKKKQLEEIKCLNMALDETRLHLEEETLQRISLENHIQSLNEDITFKDQVYQQEFTETRTKRQVEISEIDGRLAEQFETKLQQSLQALRDQYEAQMQKNRQKIELFYENKIKNLTNHAQWNNDAASTAIEELKESQSRIDSLNQRIIELEASNNSLNARIRDLENVRNNERAQHADSFIILESELARMRDEMAQQLQKYRDTMDIKVALDLEIAAYRKILESEEARK